MPDILPSHDRAAILSTGDELLIGQLLDTNSRYFAQQLTDRGIMPLEHVTVGDELPVLVAAIRRLAESVPLVIMTGGLGPTDGDLTRHAMAQVMGEPLVEDAPARLALEARLRARSRPITERQLRQAMRPASARCIPNANGTAPGVHAVVNVAAPHARADIYCLPGPPGELTPMFEQAVLPELRPRASSLVVTRLLHAIGLGESDAVDRLKGLTARDRNPLVGITASGAVLTLRIRYQGDAPRETAEREVASTESIIRQALGDFIFASGDHGLADAVLDRLKAKGRTLATVESCTGGLLAGMLTDIPGASAAMLGGWVTYANALKTALVGVPASLLLAHGAVSPEVAQAMAEGGLARSGADHALAITGIAGPDGGSDAKPVGTVYIAHAWRTATALGASASSAPGAPAQPARTDSDVRRFLFPGSRPDIRTRSARTALAMLYFALEGRPKGTPPLLWQA